MSWSIDYYEDARGRKPVCIFIDGLLPKHAKKAVDQIRLLCDYADLGQSHPDASEEGDGIWKLRVRFGKSQYRFFYFSATGQKFILVHAYLKSSPKTPPQEFAQAKKNRDEWLARKKP